MNPTPNPSPGPAGLPPTPWILLDRTVVEQSAALFERLEQWLAGGNPTAAKLCARACSAGDADVDEVAAWVGTLAAHLHHRIDLADAAADPPSDGAGDAGVGSWS